MSMDSGQLGASQQRKPRPGWFFTPRWHWRYWIGHRMRQETYTVPRGASFAGLSWRYRTFGQHARMVLEEQAHGRKGDNLTSAEIRARYGYTSHNGG